MSNISHGFILIQFLDDPYDYPFEDELEKAINDQLKKGEALFVLDNHSDATALHYAMEVLKADQVTIICNIHSDSPIGNIGALLNRVVKHPKARLFTNKRTKEIKPFMIRLNGQEFTLVSDLFL